jgi:predicted Zn finger-like uncharacterized protein
MFTVCPKCTLTLVVTTVDLRAGQGYVRCGRCANVFNALIALREGDPNGGTSDTANRRLQETAPRPPANPAVGSGVAMDPQPAPAPAPPPEPEPEPTPEPEPELTFEPEPAIESEEFEAGSEIVLEGDEIAAGESLEFDASSTDVSEIFVAPPEAEHDTGSGTFESVVLGEEAPQEAQEPDEFQESDEPELVADDVSHTDTIAADDWSLLDDDPPADAESVIEESPLAAANDEVAAKDGGQEDGGQDGDAAWVEEMFAEAEAEAEKARTIERVALQVHETDEDSMVEAARANTGAAAPSDTVLEPLLGTPARRRPRWQYVSGIALLALVLLGQVVHFNRQNLVLHNSVGPLISRVYGWFNVTLVPRWDLSAYDVRLRSVEAEGGEGSPLLVRLSVHNKSNRVQPLPLLRLTLLDRFSNPVATRDLAPREYLSGDRADRLIEPDDRIDTEVRVVDPGRAAEGYIIDACLRSEAGTVGCAADVRAPTAG